MAKLWRRSRESGFSDDGLNRQVHGGVPFVNPGEKLLRTMAWCTVFFDDVPPEAEPFCELYPNLFAVVVTRGNPPLPPDIVHEDGAFAPGADVLHIDMQPGAYIQFNNTTEATVTNRSLLIPIGGTYTCDTSVERAAGEDHLGIWPYFFTTVSGAADTGTYRWVFTTATLREV